MNFKMQLRNAPCTVSKGHLTCSTLLSASINRNQNTYVVPLEREEDKSAEEQNRSSAEGNYKRCIRSTRGPCTRFCNQNPTPKSSSIFYAHKINLVLPPQSCEGSLPSAHGSRRQAGSQRCSTSGHSSREMCRKKHQKEKKLICRIIRLRKNHELCDDTVVAVAFASSRPLQLWLAMAQGGVWEAQ